MCRTSFTHAGQAIQGYWSPIRLPRDVIWHLGMTTSKGADQAASILQASSVGMIAAAKLKCLP